MKNKQSLLMEKAHSVFPFCYDTQVITISPLLPNVLFNDFRFGKTRFCEFSDAALFAQLKPYLIEIDIKDECQLMQEDGFLEITVPVLGMCDFKNGPSFLSQSILNASFIAINGFGAKQQTKNSYPQVDFIKVLDIADNMYEIMRAPDGTLELPEQGMGLFSLIKEITYILAYRQVIRGDGLDNLVNEGVEKNKLYMLPPIHTDESFVFHVCLSHIDQYNRRLVDSIRAIEVDFLKARQENTLNQETRMQLIKTLYTEYDFMRDYLKQSPIPLSKEQDYNNFLLRPEVFSKIYADFVHDLAWGYIDVEVLIDLIKFEDLSEYFLSDIPSDFHESVILSHIEEELREGRFEALKIALRKDLMV